MEENCTNMTELPMKPGAQTPLMQWFAEQGMTLTQLDDWSFMFDWETDEGKSMLLGIEASDYNNFVDLYNYGWHEVSKWDAEAVEELKEKINIYNQCSTFKYVYWFEDDDSIQVGMKIHFPLYEGIPNMQKYLEKLFDSFVDPLESFKSNIIPCQDILDFSLPKSNLDMVVESLEEIQCEPKIEDIGQNCFVVTFEFQADIFEIHVDTQRKSVTLYDRGIFSYNKEDRDKHELVRKVINDINDYFKLTLYYKEKGECVYVQSRFVIPCVAETVFRDMQSEILSEIFRARYRFYSLLGKELQGLFL